MIVFYLSILGSKARSAPSAPLSRQTVPAGLHGLFGASAALVYPAGSLLRRSGGFSRINLGGGAGRSREAVMHVSDIPPPVLPCLNRRI